MEHAQITETDAQRIESRPDWAEWGPYQKKQKFAIAEVQMPAGESGLVIGSGPHTQEWKKRGWLTLDIEPTDNPDFIQDANTMSTVVHISSQDYVLAEFIRFDNEGIEGISPDNLIKQSHNILKPGGILVVKTGNILGLISSTLPKKPDLSRLLLDGGFNVLTVTEPYRRIDQPDATIFEQQLVYYAQKTNH